jgi:hypothetical protein
VFIYGHAKYTVYVYDVSMTHDLAIYVGYINYNTYTAGLMAIHIYVSLLLLSSLLFIVAINVIRMTLYCNVFISSPSAQGRERNREKQRQRERERERRQLCTANNNIM